MAPAFTTHAPVRRQDGQVWWTPSPGDGAYTGEAQAWNQPAQDDNQQWQATTDNWQPQPADVESESESQSQPQTRESNDSSSLTETSSLSEESQPSITSTTTTKSASIASDSAEELFSTDSAGQNDAKVKAISLSDLSSQSSATSTSATALPDTTPGNFFSEIGRSPTYIAITVVVCLAIASLVLGCLFWLLRRRCQARSKRDRILNTENHWWNRFSGMFICRETSDCDSLSSSCSDHAEKFEPKPFFLYRDNKVSNDSTRSLHPNSRVEEGRAVHNPAFIPHSALAIPPAVHYPSQKSARQPNAHYMAWTNKQSKSQFPARTPQVQGRHCTGHFYHPGITSIPEEPNTPDMASSIERSSSRSSSIWSSSTGNTSEQQKSTLDVMSKIKPRPFRSPGTHVVRYKSGASTNSNRKNSTTSSRWLTLRRNLAQARELREAEDSAEDAASTASYQEKRTSWERLEEDEHRAQLKTMSLIRARERRARSRDSVSIRSISS